MIPSIQQAAGDYRVLRQFPLQANTPANNEYFFVRANNAYIKIVSDSLLYIKGEGSFTRFYISNGDSYMVLVSLKKLEEVLPDNFIRIHRTYIINMNHVNWLGSASVHIHQAEIPLNRDGHDALYESVVKNNLLIPLSAF